MSAQGFSHLQTLGGRQLGFENANNFNSPEQDLNIFSVPIFFIINLDKNSANWKSLPQHHAAPTTSKVEKAQPCSDLSLPTSSILIFLGSKATNNS
jgi:hypothetical protein